MEAEMKDAEMKECKQDNIELKMTLVYNIHFVTIMFWPLHIR